MDVPGFISRQFEQTLLQHVQNGTGGHPGSYIGLRTYQHPRIYRGADMSLARFSQYSVLFSADMTAQQSPQFNARVKKKWSFNSTPSNCLHVVYRNNFTVSFSLYYITRQCEYWRKHRRTAIDVANSSSTQSVLLRYNVASEDNRITDKQKPQLAAKNKRNHDVAEKDMHN